MCKWFKTAALLLGCIVFTSCASNVTTTVRVGFEHGELVNKRDGTEFDLSPGDDDA